MRPGKPLFRAELIGSLLRALEAHERGEVGNEERREIEDRCIREVVALQEETGIPTVTDGEFHTPILTRIQGAELTGRVGFHLHYEDEDIECAPSVHEVTGRLGHPPSGLVVEDYTFTIALTDHTVPDARPPMRCGLWSSGLRLAGGSGSRDTCAADSPGPRFTRGSTASVLRQTLSGATTWRRASRSRRCAPHGATGGAKGSSPLQRMTDHVGIVDLAESKQYACLSEVD